MALDMVADRLMLDTTGRRSLRLHDSGIFLLPRANVVARLIDATNENRERAGLAVQVTDWLCRQGFPAIEPVHDMPYEASGVVMTFWRHLPQPPDQAPPPVLARALGSLLRELHALPAPPFQLPTLDPFARLRAAIEMDTQRSETVLSHADHAFLVDRIADLRQAYAGLEFPRGHGLIHNDAHIGNLLASAERPYGYVLADWESARLGPREVEHTGTTSRHGTAGGCYVTLATCTRSRPTFGLRPMNRRRHTSCATGWQCCGPVIATRYGEFRRRTMRG